MSVEVEILWVPCGAQDLESWIALVDHEVVGHIYLLHERDDRLKFLDAWVHPEWRRKGIFRKLWEARWESVQTRYPGKVVYAWCKPGSLPLLLEKGFETGEICTYVEKKIE
jgi:GNAT superfamily N-acetyltransferase